MGDSTLRLYALALFSSDRSGTQSTPTYFNFQRQWTMGDFPLKSQVLGAVLEGPLAGACTGKMVVIADGDFAVNENGQQLNPDNVSLLVNGIDWLSDDTGLIELRTKGVSSRPIKQMEDHKRALIKWMNFSVAHSARSDLWIYPVPATEKPAHQAHGSQLFIMINFVKHEWKI